jgi:hypothetical protein
MRVLSLALLVALFSVRGFAQAQTNLPEATHGDEAKDHVHKAAIDAHARSTPAPDKRRTGVEEPWFNQQSDLLLQALACFLDKQSIENQQKAESKNGLNPPDVLAARVKLLAALVQKNSRNHCQ